MESLEYILRHILDPHLLPAQSVLAVHVDRSIQQQQEVPVISSISLLHLYDADSRTDRG